MSHITSNPDEMVGKAEKSSSEASLPLEGVYPAVPTQQAEDMSSHPDNPRNWPIWKKNVQILMVAFHSMVATFMAAGIIPAFDSMAEEYGVTVPEASYLTSIQVRVPITTTCIYKFEPETLIYATTDPGVGAHTVPLETDYLHLRSIPRVAGLRSG